MFNSPKPQAPPPVPLPYKSTQDGSATTSAMLAATQAGGFASTNPTGGLGVPSSSVKTSSASLLGV